MENHKIALAIATSQGEDARFFLEELAKENASLRREQESQQLLIKHLKEENEYYRKQLFGPSSEKRHTETIPTTQLNLIFNEAEVVVSSPVVETEEPEKGSEAKPEPKKRGRKPLPANLPRKEERTSPSKTCSCCGKDRVCLGVETSEQIDVQPAKVIVKQTVREKLVCKNPDCDEFEKVETAPLEPQIIPQSLATPGTLAHVITAKYADGSPLYRQESQFLRMGIEISRGTLANWVIKAAEACYTVNELLLEELRAGPAANMDETPLQVLNEPGRKNTDESRMWVARGGPPERPVVIFRYSPSRSGKVASDILGSFQGFLQTDGYIGYELIGKRPGIRHLGCLAHVRRKFFDVEKINKGSPRKGVAREALDIIKEIYAVERKADHLEMDPDQRKALRQEEAKPLLDKLKAHLDTYKDSAPPKSLLGKAIAYALNQWDLLLVYLEDGILRPDNNAAENALRPFVVGRKNWLFAASTRGAEASAILYSIIETAKANGLEPYAYLRFLFTELPKAKLEADIRALLPQYVDRNRLAENS